MTKELSDRFFQAKIIREILGDYTPPQEIKEYVNKFFEGKDFRKEYHILKRYGYWLSQGKTNWEELDLQLSRFPRMSEEYWCVLYGERDGKRRWAEHIEHINKNLDTKVEYWVNLGFDKDAAKEQISKVQTERSKKSMKNYNPIDRCARKHEFWTNKGYSEEEAHEAVRQIQKRDLSYYIGAYGEIEGTKRYEKCRKRRKKTWDKKTPEQKAEHGRKAAPKTFNPNGQEMKAIELFLEANPHLLEYKLLYGPPNDQYYQHIPGVGTRRYDFAALDENNIPVVVFEYHGPGHINFSDYRECEGDEAITIKGTALFWLGTKREAYENDLVKKTHILTTYPNCHYQVMWHYHYKLSKEKQIELLRI